ncbi:MAG: metalloregulator ArsR/SmtB family transcription factor [Kofleriaceae bacterium]
MNQLDATFGALADGTRRGVIDLLRKKPWRAGDLADELGASRPAMSKHLRILRTSGLVEASHEADARFRLYSLRPEKFGELREWLDQVERFWEGQLGAFAAHVAKKVKR